jgi:hypothetical protein
LATKESVVTARWLTAGLVLAGAMATVPAQASDMCRPARCACACPAPARAARHVRIPGKAYAERFYDYRSASYVDNRRWHGEWEVAPDDGYVAPPPYYAPPAAYYPSSYPPAEDFGPPPINYGPSAMIYGSLDERGFDGGVGYGADGGGGGGGGYGQVFFADGGLGTNGYGNGQVNPSAGPVQGYAGRALYAVQHPPSATK